MGPVGLFSCSAPFYAIACRATQGAGHACMQMDNQGGVGAALLVAVRVSVQGAQFSQTGVFPCHRHHGGSSLPFHNSFSIPSASSSTILSIITIYSRHNRENCLVVLRVIRFLLLDLAWLTNSLVWKVRVIWVITALSAIFTNIVFLTCSITENIVYPQHVLKDLSHRSDGVAAHCLQRLTISINPVW